MLANADAQQQFSAQGLELLAASAYGAVNPAAMASYMYPPAYYGASGIHGMFPPSATASFQASSASENKTKPDNEGDAGTDKEDDS